MDFPTQLGEVGYYKLIYTFIVLFINCLMMIVNTFY